MMDQVIDWVSAREAFDMDIASTPAGQSLVVFAANGDLPTRCRRIDGLMWPKAGDGYIALKVEFWEDMLPLTGSKYRGWRTSTFSIRKTIHRSRLRAVAGRDVTAWGVQFQLSAIYDLLGRPALPEGIAKKEPPRIIVRSSAEQREIDLIEWAKDAADRGVKIRDAGADARERTGNGSKAREALALEYENRGKTVSQGRTVGS